ncbi:MAG: Gfo/Idh/MocA family oxidoreductase [Defluviitaleaceae bacterium]|nr:Gfo/Idh/MocA family oxidoreductase [Defluviitaleaceae bacterium]
MNKVRIGIAGIGNMGKNHTKTLFEGQVEEAVITAVCDTNPERFAHIQENYPGIKTFNTAAEMYKSGEIDAVIIATPHYEHPPQVIEALEHKIHVMCEKPAGVYTKNVREMNEIASKTDTVFAIMFNQRTNPAYKKMREMVVNGDLGEIRRTNWIITNWFRTQFYYDSGDWRATWAGEGGGVLLNQCPHNLDLWQWICGMPSKITAFCHEGKWHDIEVEDDVTAYAEYPNGATGVFVTTTADAPGTNRFEITGEKGKLVYENDKLTFYKLETSTKELLYGSKVSFITPKYEVIDIKIEGENPQHKGVLKAFAAHILRGEPLVAEGAEGINSLMISNAMYLSGWLGKSVPLPLDEDAFYAELSKRNATSRYKKSDGALVDEDLSGSYGN